MTYGSVALLACIEPKLTINVFIIPEVGCIALRSIKFLKLELACENRVMIQIVSII